MYFEYLGETLIACIVNMREYQKDSVLCFSSFSLSFGSLNGRFRGFEDQGKSTVQQRDVYIVSKRPIWGESAGRTVE